MDIYCPRCGEPCDAYELHNTVEYAKHDADVDRVRSYDDARKIFFDTKQGCGVLFDGQPCEPRDTERGQASAILHDMLGDDVDAIASMLDGY